MPETNSLQTILTNAKQICWHKFQLVQRFSNGQKTAELKDVKKQLEEVFTPIEEPSFFLDPPELDTTEVSMHIVTINLMNPKETQQYLDKIAVFIQFMKEKVLAKVTEDSEVPPSDWNMRTMNALTIMNRKVAGRKRVFLGQDPNLPNDPDYKAVTAEHKQLSTNYIELLETNQVQSDASDVTVFNTFTTILPTIAIVLDFITQMKQINQFITGKIPAALEVDVPS